MSADEVFELARHLTVRDREIVLLLYDVQVLTTDQLALLFFSSVRRCQDRMLFLYRHRVVDRFYPPSPFGAGKPQAHWLLDEAGAILVATILDVDRKQLRRRRREDWASHRQLAHRLEANRFMADLIAATLSEPAIGVTAWYSSRDATAWLDAGDLLRPDGGFILDVPAGPIECLLEWDRGTETQQRLAEKLDRYRLVDESVRGGEQPRSVLFVVPGPGRVKTLRRAHAELEPKRERRRQDRWRVSLESSWPLLTATVSELRRHGPLGRVWRSITNEHEPPQALVELPVRADLWPANPARALGRRWRHEQPDFWERLSPLHRHPPAAESAPASSAEPSQPESEPEPAEPNWIEQHRQAELEEARRENAAARSGSPLAAADVGCGLGGDLNASAGDGLMDGPDE